ncbi:S24 family peptidase [Devosia lacusdianchii]|uniref:S24 family peptidase n=1 Tax=Devosia lacusdianchii TaxID=2917991 RepID=UPI001F06C9EB|nr:S24 family peptidase [Devosia sp. JXJ CY 41]
MPTAHGGGHYATAEPAPLALGLDWLKARGVSPDHLRYLEISGDEGGASLPAGSIVIIDTNQVAPKSGAHFAMDFGGEAQLRRLIRTRSGQLELTHVNPA